MLLVKKELIQKDEAGDFKNMFVKNITMFTALVILEATDEAVFGYYRYSDKSKEYFLKKVYYNNAGDTYFIHNGSRQYLGGFLRVGKRLY